MMRGAVHTIRLHGRLRKFGATIRLACTNPADAARALMAQIPGFREALGQGEYYVIRRQPGKQRTVYEDGQALTMGLGESCTLHFVPAVAGAKNGGVGKAILGAVITAVAVVGAIYTGGATLAAFGGAAFGVSSAFTWGGMAGLGLMLTFSGISQMMAPSVKVGQNSSAEERRSFILNGQTEAVVQGNPVPVVYGRCRVPLTLVSVGLAPEAI